jgi:hypothetical protein
MSTRSYPIFTSSISEPIGANAGDIWHNPSTNSIRQRVYLNNTTAVWRTPGVSQNTVTVPTGTSITPNCDTSDVVAQINTQATGTLTINAPVGTPSDGQKLVIRINSTTVQTFSWNTTFVGSSDMALPAVSTGSGKTDYIGFIYNSTTGRWHLLAKNFGF